MLNWRPAGLSPFPQQWVFSAVIDGAATAEAQRFAALLPRQDADLTKFQSDKN